MRRDIFRGLMAALCTIGLLSAADNGNDNSQGNNNNQGDDHPSGITLNKPDVFGINGSETGKAKPGPGSGTGINYHGGPVITDHINIYYIWYGAWTSSSQSILNSLASGIGGSAYFNINTTYYQGSGASQVFVPNSPSKIRFGGSVSDNYSHGKSLSDSAIAAIVSGAIQGTSTLNNQALPADENGVYFVLTATDVTESSGFCRSYCGWHTWGTMTLNNVQKKIKYAFVGNPAVKCPSACTNGTLPPNGDVGADGMASVIAHELEESATDPLLNAWYDKRGEENADKCAWTFGTTQTTPSGGVYNVTLGSTKFLIQQNWLNVGSGGCALSY